jgi:hypothetical protein
MDDTELVNKSLVKAWAQWALIWLTLCGRWREFASSEGWAVQIVVCANQGIEQREGPEPQQRQFMAIKRILRRKRQEVVNRR